MNIESEVSPNLVVGEKEQKIRPTLLPSKETLTREIENKADDKNLAKKQEFSDELAEFAEKRQNKKKWLAYLGMFLFFSGAGWIKKDDIFAAGNRAFRSEPVISYLDKLASKKHQIDENFKVTNPDQFQIENAQEGSEIKLKNLKITFGKETDFAKENDRGVKIPLNNPYLKNLLDVKFSYLKSPENPEQFPQIIKTKVGKYLNAEDQNDRTAEYRNNESHERKDKFNRGDVPFFVEMVNDLIKDGFEYDQDTASWHDYDSDKFGFKIGKTNPIKAMISATGMPIDKFIGLKNKSVGYCSHYAEAVCYLADEIKKIYPEKFQNTYATTFFSGYKFHTYNAFVHVKSNNEVSISTTNYGMYENPGYDLLRAFYNRGIITEDKFFEVAANYITENSKLNKGVQDKEEFMEFALYTKSKSAMNATKKVLLCEVNDVNLDLFSKEVKKIKNSDSYMAQDILKKDFAESRNNSLKTYQKYIDMYNQTARTDLLKENPFELPKYAIDKKVYFNIRNRFENWLKKEKYEKDVALRLQYLGNLVHFNVDTERFFPKYKDEIARKIKENLSRMIKYHQEYSNRNVDNYVRDLRFENNKLQLISNFFEENRLAISSEPKIKHQFESALAQIFHNYLQSIQRIKSQDPRERFLSDEEIKESEEKLKYIMGTIQKVDSTIFYEGIPKT